MNALKISRIIFKENASKFLLSLLVCVVVAIGALDPAVEIMGTELGWLGVKEPVHTIEDLEKNHRNKRTRMVTFTAKEVYDTKLKLFERGSVAAEELQHSGPAKSAYALASFGDRQYVVVEVPLDFFAQYKGSEPHTFTGFVTDLRPSTLTVSAHVDRPPLSSQEMSGLIVPYGIQTNTSSQLIPGLIAQLFMVVALFITLSRLFYLLFPSKSKLGRTLAMYGDYEDVKNAVEDELRDGVAFTIGGLFITRSWLVNTTTKLHPAIIPLNAIIWIYEGTERVIVNGIPVGKRSYISVHTTLKKTYPVELASKQEVKQAIEYLLRQYPYILFDHDKGLVKQWKKNPGVLIEQALSQKSGTSI
ncbi:DUF6709 family protein [Paenibacillus sp. DMB20]|uniref:DUF6709 family protein n=1 Tax=Paenibacillus sp. DMB20 TaxID=1642570 RepID=UPI000627FE5F|nr:DUF6709 family protein [Paenibacillus sp. DMB20]KKO53076.1 hypothetical protein XI25_15370 [Paenibacillus sp. DMB20]